MTIGAIEALTTLLVLITGFYAWATYRILKANESVVSEMQRQSEEVARPRISIYVYTLPSRPMFHLTVRNIGSSSASNLRLNLDRPFHPETHDKDLSSSAAFSKPIPSFGPGERMDIQLGRTFVILGESRDEKLRPLTFSITADYWYGSKNYAETTNIDLNTRMMTALTTDAIVEQMSYIHDSLKNIHRELQNLRRSIDNKSPGESASSAAMEEEL
jgi:hypothetical protein